MWFLLPFVFDIIGALLDAAKPIILLVAAVLLLQALGIDVIGMGIDAFAGVISPA